jgi:hypothetical protein
MRSEDLIPAFVEEILCIEPENELALEVQERFNSVGEEDTEAYFGEESANDVGWLFEELNELCDIPYAYFGAHPGDGADYGFWIDEDVEYNFDGLKVEDTSEVPEDYTGEVLHINDHGNMTLYNSNNGELEEVWSLV